MIGLEAVGKRYGQGAAAVDALSGVTLEVAAGEYVALRGRSGSGKSTLLAILGLLERPSAGEYRLFGQPTSALPDATLSRLRAARIGFVFQAFHLLPEKSALENVMLPLRYGDKPRGEWREVALAGLEQVGLGARAQHRPQQLSGGEQQRVAIARALVNNPDILLADEPTGNLDSHTRDAVMNILEGLHAQGKTLIVVTHDEELARRAARRVRLHDGRVAEGLGQA